MAWEFARCACGDVIEAYIKQGVVTWRHMDEENAPVPGHTGERCANGDVPIPLHELKEITFYTTVDA